MSTASERLTGPPETGEGTAPGQFARETFRKLVAIYLKGSITSVVVVDGAGVVRGVVHIHDLWRTEMF